MSISTTTLRLDSNLKERIEKKLKDTGLSLNAYFTLAARQLDIQGKIPFEIKTPSEKPTQETLNAILLAQAKSEDLIPDTTPGFTDSRKMIEYMKKTCKGIKIMYKVFPEDTFIQDVNRWSKVVPNLWDEIDAVTTIMMETGRVPKEYNPHLLSNANLNYAGYLEFHLLDGKVDLLIIYTENNKKYTFRLVRLGSHQELFHEELK